MRCQIIEHVVPAQHIRELPNALSIDDEGSEVVLNLSVRQYMQIDNPQPQPGDVTIIALHANGFCKETYEPLWDDILSHLPAGVKIRSIWMTDQAQQGASYVLNEAKLGDGISEDDHPRDLLYMINHFRDQMPPPLMAVGHSMGAVQLIGLCRIHPRLFHSVALLDPWMNTKPRPGARKEVLIRLVTRKDQFKSLAAVKKAYESSAFFKSWDNRVLQRYLETAFRTSPTVLYPDDELPVVLKTPKFMEAYTRLRFNVDEVNTNADSASRIDRLQYPDMPYELPLKIPYFSPTPITRPSYLPNLRPRALFLYGTKGSAVGQEDRAYFLKITETGSGGNGGVGCGAVEEDTIKGSHFFPFENPQSAAKRLGQWPGPSYSAWREENVELRKRFNSQGKTAMQRQSLGPEILQLVKDWDKKYSKL